MSRDTKRQQLGSRKDRHSYHNFLTSIVKHLEGKHTVIDLRNESSVSGLIAFVDGLMNVEMEDVTFYNPRGGHCLPCFLLQAATVCHIAFHRNFNITGEAHHFKEFFVQCRNVRYVHIPEDLSMSEMLKAQNAALIPKPKAPRQESWKARRYQNQILSTLNEPQAGPSKA